MGTCPLLFGCGGSSQRAASANEGAAESDPDNAVDGSDRALTPVGPPPGVVVKFRATRLPALADQVFEAAQVPLRFEDILREARVQGGIFEVIDVDGTVEGALALNPKQPLRPSGFLSFGVVGVDPTLKALDGLRIEVSDGPSGVHYFSYEGEPCAVGRAIAGSPARVVCSDARDHLDGMLPYALRGLPSEMLSDAVVHWEFDMAPVRERYGGEAKAYLRWMPAMARAMHMGNPTFDRALSDGAVMIADEAGALLDEVDTLTAQVFAEEKDFRGILKARFVGQSSQTVKTLQELSSRAGAVPSLFDQIPATASAAGFSHEISKERAGPWWSILADLARGGAELQKCSRPFAQKVGQVVAAFGSTGATNAVARGPLVTSMVKGKQRLHPAWALSGTTRPFAEVQGLADDVAFVLGSPELKKLISGDVRDLPVFKKSPQKIPGVPQASVYSWELAGSSQAAALLLGAQLPEGSDEGEEMLNALDAQAGLFALFEHDGNTWMSWGKGPQEISEGFRSLTSKDAQRLGDKGALGGVRSEPAISAGYAQLSGVLGALAWALPPGSAEHWNQLKDAMPHEGTVPLTYFFKVQAAQETDATLEFRLPSEFVQDLIAVAATAGNLIENPPKD